METNQNVPVEFKFDPYKMYLYKKAMRKGKETDNRIRVNIVGNYGQGKTSLARRLIGMSCDNVTSTNGIEINRFRCKKSNAGTLEYMGDKQEDFVERMASVARSMGHKTSDVKSASELIVSLYQRQSQGITPLPVTPKMAKDRMMSTEFVTFSKTFDKTTERTETYVDFWDFGGQYTFYATHTLFHSTKALYLLVFDLSAPLDSFVVDKEFPAENTTKPLKYYAKFWVESIHSFVGENAPVVLVGTHRDKLEGDEQAKTRAVELYFEQVRRLFDDTDMICHFQEEDFAVNNNDPLDAETVRLLHFIMEKGQQVANNEIPARWIPLEQILQQERRKGIIKLKDVMEINSKNEFPLKDEKEVKLFLQYQHEKGILFYFDEESISEYVVVDPKYLIEAFRCIITPERFRLKVSSIRKLWIELQREGKLTGELLTAVWTMCSSRFMDHQHILLGFLRQHSIIAPVVEFDEESKEYIQHEWHIIPSLLQDNISEQTMRRFLEGKSQTQIRFVMTFNKSTIVAVLYHRLLSAALGRWAVLKFGKIQLLSKNMGIFKLESTQAGIIEMVHSSVELRTINLETGPVYDEISERFRRYVESVIQHEFRKLNFEIDETKSLYSKQYKCNHSSHELHGSYTASNIELLGTTKSVFCPDNYTHKDFSRKKAKAEWFLEQTSVTVFPKKALTEKDLGRLAQKAIGKNWQLLGAELGLSSVELHHIKEDNSSANMCIYTMLMRWKNMSHSNATLDVLVEILRRCPAVQVDWEEFRNIKDKHFEVVRSDKIEFSQTLSDVMVDVHGTLRLECVLNVPDATVLWRKNNNAVRTKKRTRKAVVNHNEHQLIINNVKAKDAGVYQCIFKNISTECNVKVYDKKTPVQFLQRLMDMVIVDTNIAIFRCELNKTVEDVQWYHNNRVIVPSEKYMITEEGTVHTLKIRNAVDSDEGNYCIIAAGEKSEASLRFEDTAEERGLLFQAMTDKRRTARTLFYCEADNSTELSFYPDEIIKNVSMSLEPGWLEGTLDGRVGLIPANYVEIID